MNLTELCSIICIIWREQISSKLKNVPEILFNYDELLCLLFFMSVTYYRALALGQHFCEARELLDGLMPRGLKMATPRINTYEIQAPWDQVLRCWGRTEVQKKERSNAGLAGRCFHQVSTVLNSSCRGLCKGAQAPLLCVSNGHFHQYFIPQRLRLLFTVLSCA